MLSLLSDFVFGNEKFGLKIDTSRPFFSIFGLEIYLYAIAIVFGMCMAILVAGLYFKKRGYDPYDITIYALVVIPIGVLGARAYVYIFPWSGGESNWATYFDFRGGGLGIYGGVIMGYLAALVCSKIKKQDFRIVADSIMPGLFLAQSIGRWGNYFNQEAFGNLITHDYNALPNFVEGIFGANHHGFNFYAVWAFDSKLGGWGWYQATFFYESVCTFLGFLICVLVLTRSKRYKLGWCSAFYGIYYGAVRLVIEGFRTDSLYLFVGRTETDIKISQLVSVFAIIFGVLTLCKIYRREIHALYKKLFKNDCDEVSKSRWILLGVAVALFAVGITMLVMRGVVKSANDGKGGESYLIAGVVITAVAIYAGLGVWSLFDRLKVYDAVTGERAIEPADWQTDYERIFTATICYGVIMGAFLTFGLFSLIKWGIVDQIPNGTVVFVLCLGCITAIALSKFVPTLKQLLAMRNGQSANAGITQPSAEQGLTEQTDVSKVGQASEQRHSDKSWQGHSERSAADTAVCHAERNVVESKHLSTDSSLNKFLLFVFPPKVYRDYGVENLIPFVDEEAEAKKAARKAKKQAK